MTHVIRTQTRTQTRHEKTSSEFLSKPRAALDGIR